MKVRRYPAPPGLQNALRRRLAEAAAPAGRFLVRGLLGRRRWVAAAALIVAAAASVVWFAMSPPAGTKLAHAEVVQRCVDYYREQVETGLANRAVVRDAPQPLREEEVEEVLECARKVSGLRLDAITSFPNACYLGLSPFEYGGLKGLRLDFQCRQATAPGTGMISVFAFSLSAVQCPGEVLELMSKGYVCHCAGADGKTVFCLRSPDYLFNVVTSLAEDRFRAVHVPRLIQVLDPQVKSP
jgi:hypothetical protein